MVLCCLRVLHCTGTTPVSSYFFSEGITRNILIIVDIYLIKDICTYHIPRPIRSIRLKERHWNIQNNSNFFHFCNFSSLHIWHLYKPINFQLLIKIKNVLNFHNSLQIMKNHCLLFFCSQKSLNHILVPVRSYLVFHKSPRKVGSV